MAINIEGLYKRGQLNDSLCEAVPREGRTSVINTSINEEELEEEELKVDLRVGSFYRAQRIRDIHGRYIRREDPETMGLFLIEDGFAFFEKHGDRFPVPIQSLLDGQEFMNGNGNYRLIGVVEYNQDRSK